MNKHHRYSLFQKYLNNSLFLVLILLIIPFYLIIGTIGSNAAPKPKRRPTAASIDSVSKSAKMDYRQPSRSGSTNIPITNNNNTQYSLSGVSRKLIIYKGTAGLGFKDKTGRIGAANLFTAFSHDPTKPSQYFYPCESEGKFTIAWKADDERSKNDGCAAWKLKGKNLQRISNLGNNNVAFKPHNLNKIKPKNQPFLKAEALGNVSRYCSAVADSGQEWSAVVSNLAWDIFSPNDPCEKAVRQCQEISGNRSCSVINMGEHESLETDPELTAVLKCNNNQLLTMNGKLTALNQWLSTSVNKALDCSLHMLDTNDRLVFPTTDQPTVITTDIGANGKPQITVLAGEVQVVSANPQLQPSTLKAGEVCNSFDLPFRPESQQPPQQQACQISQANDRQAIRTSDAVANFFSVRQSQADTGTWSSDLKLDIQQYEQAVNQQFFDPSQPILR